MTKNELITVIEVALRDEPATVKNMVKKLVPGAIDFVLHYHQWDFRTVINDETAPGGQDWMNYPSKCEKEIALYHSGRKEPVDYISPQEYARWKAANSAGGTDKAVFYTVASDKKMGLRFYFYPAFTSDTTITMIYSQELDTDVVGKLNQSFIDAVRAQVLFQIAKVSDMPTYPAIKDARNDALSHLVSYEQGQRGRIDRSILPEYMQSAMQGWHR